MSNEREDEMHNSLEKAIAYALARDILMNPAEIEARANARIEYFK